MSTPAALTETPQPRRKWRWQIGLRTWLVLLSLLCVWLGWWVSAAQRQKRAVAKLAALDVYVVRDIKGTLVENRIYPTLFEPGQDVWLGVDFWYPAVEVRSYQPGRLEKKEEILAAIQDLPQLQSVVLSDLPITNSELSPFRQLRHLNSLCLHQSQIKEGKCDALRGMKLTWLGLNRSRFDDRGLAALQDMKTLEHLDLTRTKVTDAGLVYLEGHTSLKMLRLNRSLVTKAGYEKLQKKLPGCSISWEPLLNP